MLHLKSFLGYLWLFLFIAMLINLIKLKYIYAYTEKLKTLYPLIWAKITSTDIMLGQITTQLNFMKFIFYKEYKSLDQDIAKDGDKIRNIFVRYLIIFSALFFLTIGQIILGNT